MRRRFIVHGLVQGVNFRATTAAEARRLGLRGRVWNREDGAVECVAQGEQGALERLARWLEDGPRLARVEHVETSDVAGGPDYESFEIS